jgi:hypothetical protein
MNPSVLEAALVYNSSPFLACDQIVIIDDIEQLIGHGGYPEYRMNKGRKGLFFASFWSLFLRCTGFNR